ncbi:uncharacterized protein LOC143064113 [Mytilus galloprovincialis]|uniref:uncharacterized protein LOC143064113 n=1 Tax=Mytilus galloprovincialis TaxID=29158 RepID=UPI003F7B398E
MMSALSERSEKSDSANSSQIRTPKPVYVCSVCTDEVKAKYLCQPCKKYFCEKCKSSHTSNAQNAKHKFTEILETESETPDLSLDLAKVSSPEIQKTPPRVVTSVTSSPKNTSRSTGRAKNHNDHTVHMDYGNTPRGKYSKCQRHPTKDIQLHCVECNKIVCSECIVEVHQRHQFVSIEEAGTRLKGHFHTILAPVKTFYHDELETAYNNLEVAEEQYSVKTEQTIDDIHKRASQLHEDIDRIRDSIISSIETKQKQDMDEFVTTKEVLSDRLAQTGDVISRVENAIENDNDTSMLRAEHDFTTLITNVDRNLTLREPKPARFAAGLSTEERVKDLFGNTVQADEPDNTMATWRMRGDEDKLEISKDLDLSRVLSVPVGDGQPIHTLVALGHAEVWFSTLSNSKQAQLFGIDGRIEKPLELEFSVKDLSVSRPGDLFLSCFDTRCVKRIRLNGTVETFYNTSPLHPLGIHVLRSGSVIVCVVDQISVNMKQMKPYSKRQLVKVSKTGKVIKRMAYNLDLRLFTLPFKVNETVDEEIVVLDKSSKDKGRLIMFTRNEQVKFVYNGPQSIRTEYPFCPMDLVCDNFGHTIVVDSNNNAIHMLDKFGKVLRFHQIGRDWIDIPWSVAVDNRGLMLVGDSAGTMHILRYLLSS